MSDDVVIRTSNDGVVFDVELRGKRRRVLVTREAIEDYLQLTPEAAALHTQDQRLDFVREYLPVIIQAAKLRLANTHLDADVMVIRTGDIQAGDARG